MLKRKIRRVGSSLVITIPSQIATVYDYQEGMELEIEIKPEYLIYRKTKR